MNESFFEATQKLQELYPLMATINLWAGLIREFEKVGVKFTKEQQRLLLVEFLDKIAPMIIKYMNQPTEYEAEDD